MSAAVGALLLTISTLCGCRGVSAVLSRPTNVRLTSYNMDLVLRWDAPGGAAPATIYTTEYNTTIFPFRAGCVNISSLECSFTGLSTSINEYATYTGRVRAQLGAESSDWVESNQMTLDEDTIIGPPDVSLLSNGETIEVSIKDPVFVVSALSNIYIFASYNITYWKEGQKEKARSISNIQQNRVVLDKLDLWTKYCVQVQIHTKRNPKPSEPSTTVCESTSKEESPWVAAVVTFVFMAVVVALLVVAVVYRKRIANSLCPKDALPQHFKEYLPDSSMYLAMQSSHPPEENFDRVSVIAGDGTVEEGRPLEAGCSNQPDVREQR